MPLKRRAGFNQHIFLLVDMRCVTMLLRGCSGVTYGGPTLSRCILCRLTGLIVITRPASKTYCPVLNVCRPAPATLAQHLTNVGPMSACALLSHSHQHKTLLSIDQLLAGTSDRGPASIRHWVSVVLTCSGLRHQPQIVMNIE